MAANHKLPRTWSRPPFKPRTCLRGRKYFQALCYFNCPLLPPSLLQVAGYARVPPSGNFSCISTNSTKACPIMWQFPWLVIFLSTIKITWNSTKNNYSRSSSFVQLKTSYIFMTNYNLFFKSLARAIRFPKNLQMHYQLNVPDHGGKCPTKQTW